MENIPLASDEAQKHTTSSPEIAAAGRKRSGSGGSILSKFPFLRSSDSKSALNESRHPDSSSLDHDGKPPRALAGVLSQQQQKTRKRKGSLRKVALLGRGAARERRELKPLAIDTSSSSVTTTKSPVSAEPAEEASSSFAHLGAADAGPGLGITEPTPRTSMDGSSSFTRKNGSIPTFSTPRPPESEQQQTQATSPEISYTSTTDEEDGLSIPVRVSAPLPPELGSLSSGSESYFPNRATTLLSSSLQRRRSVKHAKSPLSLQGLTASPLPAAHEDHDYNETAWWGWLVLIVTWFVFIIGMGSCLNVWSWAWDVGTTPYAPPELEDDPTLPIIGYYPALLILTCIMAWVWVVVAWVGMKYFKHAKIGSD